MTKLLKSHPFVLLMLEAEKLEQAKGLTDEVLALRSLAKTNYSKFYNEYITAKSKKQEKEAMKKGDEKDERKRARHIRRLSISRDQFKNKGFGRGPRDL